MSGLVPSTSAVLVVVDIQEKLYRAISNKEAMLQNCLKTIEFCRRIGIPILVTEQYPQGLGHTLPQVREVLGEEYRPYDKTTFNCLDTDPFFDAFTDLDRNWMILVGIETHVCVAQTAISAIWDYKIDADPDNGVVGKVNGFNSCVLADCVGARTEAMHYYGIERMRSEGVTVSCMDAFFYEMLLEAKTPDHALVMDLLK